jgi:hypothetical protein
MTERTGLSPPEQVPDPALLRDEPVVRGTRSLGPRSPRPVHASRIEQKLEVQRLDGVLDEARQVAR